LWVSTMTGATPRLLVRPQKAFDVMTEGTDAVASATWSADGRHVLFSRHDSPHVESVPATGGTPSRVFSAPRGLRVGNMGVQLRDGSMVLSLVRGGPTRLAESGSQVALWRARTDAATGSPAEPPHQVTEWRDGDVSAVSASTDGKRVVFLSVLSQADVYVASFDQRGRRLRDTPRRMTLDERDDWPCAWTPDGQAVIFYSDRNGSSDIFVQNVDGDSADVLVSGPDEDICPRLTPDGRWVLFSRTVPGAPETLRIMRVPLSGGYPEELVTGPRALPRCGDRDGCVVLERHHGELVVSTLDPLRGKGHELTRIPFANAEDLSPDGSRLAVVIEDGGRRNRIRLVSLRGQPPLDIVVADALLLDTLDWSRDGTALFSVNVVGDERQLLHITLDGRSRVLHRGPEYAIQSPDRSRLALASVTRLGNAWLLSGL
jgi:dipeptidyl aminopeptidase/acylaminoacyl peptidase